MRFLVRATVATKGKATNEELAELVAPTGLAEAMSQLHHADGDPDDQPAGNAHGGRKIARDSLSALLQLGILREDDGRVVIGDYGDQRWRKAEQVSPSSFLASLELAVLAPDGQHVAADLIGGTSVMFAADSPLRPFDGFDEGSASRKFVDHQQVVLESNSRDDWAVVNKERWGSFRRLGPAIGWVAPLHTRGRFGLVPNAATAVRRWLSSLDSDQFGAAEFLLSAADRFPFFDGGSASKRPLEATGTLSGGLSLTLLSLVRSGSIEFVQDADTARYSLSLGSGHQETFTGVVIRRTMAKKRSGK
jgi:hypothetical protein